MDEFIENTNEYKRIAGVGVKVTEQILDDLKGVSSNSESSVTLFSGFDNITLLYLNLLQLLNTGKNRVFCKTSLLALSRSMIELTNTIHFFFLDSVDETEKEFRLLMFNYMSSKDRFEIVKKMNASNDQKQLWSLTKEKIDDFKNRIINHECFTSLIENSKVADIYCLIDDTNKRNKYYKRHLILQSRGIKTELVDWYYKLSSTFTHGSPASIDSARQKYINKDYLEYDSTGETLSTLQVASSFYCCSLIDIISYFKLSKDLIGEKEIKLIQDYKGVITNGH